MSKQHLPNIILVGGPALTGKSTVARGLEINFGYSYLEGDSLHPPANIEKMRRGEPLTDDDRYPWLNNVATAIKKELKQNPHVVATCSALQPSYREYVRKQIPDLAVLYITASFELLHQRALERGEAGTHFFNAAKNPQLLHDQLARNTPPYAEVRSAVLDLNTLSNPSSEEIVFEAAAKLLYSIAP